MPEVSCRLDGQRQHPLTALLIATVAGSMLSACLGDTAGSDSTTNPRQIQVVAEGPFTGDQASIGMGALQAVKLAVDDFNSRGGAHGTRVQLVIWDDRHDANVAATQQAQGLGDPTILRMIGPMNADVAAASETRLQRAGPPLPFISESVADAKLTDAGLTVAHRVTARDERQATLAAQFMINQGGRKIEIIDSGTDYSRPMADAAEAYLHANASVVTTERSTARRGGKDFKTIVSKLKAFGADWVFFADEGPDTIVLAQQMVQAGLKLGENIQLLVTDQVINGHVPTADLQGALVSQITADPQSVPGASGFVNTFKAKYGKDSLTTAGPFYGSAYAATQVLLQAINASPVKDGMISRADVLSHLGSDTFSTIFGPVKFDPKGDPQKVAISI